MSVDSPHPVGCDDVILLHAGEDRWVAYNLFARTAVGLDRHSLQLLDQAAGEGPFTLWKIAWFANEEGTLADPTCFRRNLADWGEPQRLDRDGAIRLLQRQWILIADEAAYRQRFARKTSPVDGKHFGNFHDQVGAQLLLGRRPVSEWWLWQKFTDERRSIRRDNLYGAVQWPNLERYFARTIRPGLRVLDLGCGTGIYSHLMAGFGAEVLGVDPSEDYLEIARRNFAGDRVTFASANIGHPGALANIPSDSMDMVFMSDALLFYFVKVSAKDTQDLSVLLQDIFRILSPEGCFVSVEPHPVFYLAPWLGADGHPFTAVTEYRNRNFSTTPNFAQTIQAVASEGFLVRWMEEFYAEDTEKVAPRAAGFAAEFPLWTLFEFVKNAHSR